MAKLILILFVVGGLPLKGFGQDQRVVDSLLVIAKQGKPREQYQALHAVAAQYVDRDNRTALHWADSAQAIAFLHGDSLSMVRSQALMAQILFRLGKTREVISILRTVEANMEIERFPAEHLSIQNLFGISYLVMSRFDRSLEYLYRTYEAAKELSDHDYQAISLKNIGIVYYKLKDYAKALPYMIKALEIEQQMGKNVYVSLMNISLCYTYLNDFDKARDYLEQSISHCGENCGLQPMTHITYTAGCLYLGMKQYDRAEIEFLNSLKYARELADFRMQLDNIYLLSKMYIQRHELRRAQTLLYEGQGIIKKGIPYNMEMIKFYDEMSQLYLSMRDYQQATYYQSQYILLRDSIYNEALTNNLIRIESEFSQQENLAKIAAQDRMLAINKIAIERQQLVNRLIIALLSVSLILAGLIFRNYYQKKRLNQLLEMKVADRTNQLKMSHHALLRNIQERELSTTKILQTLKNGIRQIRGVCAIATKEQDSSQQTCIEAIDKTATRLSEFLESCVQRERTEQTDSMENRNHVD